MGPNIKEGTRQSQEALMSNNCLINHCWYNVEKLTVSDSSNLKAQHKVLCKRDERKTCNKFLQNHRGKGDFSVENLGLFFESQCLLTQLSFEVLAME